MQNHDCYGVDDNVGEEMPQAAPPCASKGALGKTTAAAEGFFYSATQECYEDS